MRYRDRRGNTYIVESGQDRFLKSLYGSLPGRMMLKLLTSRFVSRVGGLYMKSPFSALKIDSFIRKNNIKMKDYLPCKYASYNDFFTRKIRKSRRPVDMAPDVLISPSDGKVSVFKVTENLAVRIKNRRYTVKELFRTEDFGREFAGGYLYVIRLTVDNYHRYCYADSGVKSDNCYLPGLFHTVNPVALESVPVFHENAREYTVIESDNFGKMVQMEVGAMMVGKIVNFHGSRRVRRGQEKGFFEFGGSTIVLLVKNTVKPDEDLIRNTKADIETIVKMGERIGSRNVL